MHVGRVVAVAVRELVVVLRPLRLVGEHLERGADALERLLGVRLRALVRMPPQRLLLVGAPERRLVAVRSDAEQLVQRGVLVEVDQVVLVGGAAARHAA